MRSEFLGGEEQVAVMDTLARVLRKRLQIAMEGRVIIRTARRSRTALPNVPKMYVWSVKLEARDVKGGPSG